jgi:tetratricopeptide (TPR) repeat protein
MRRIFASVVLVAACGKGDGGRSASDKPAADPAAKPAAAVDPRNAPAAGESVDKGKHADKGKTAPPEVPPAARAEYRERLAAGRKHAKDKRWGEAVTEFEGALAAIPMDGRALSELGWVAFQAGDHAKARKANADAVRVTHDRELKGASLYNLGRVAEAQSDASGAARFYRESMALRPHKAVAARLAALGKKPPAPGEAALEAPCAEPAAQAAVCDCLKKSVEPEEGEAVACEVVDDVVLPEGAVIARVDQSSTEHQFYLLVEGKRGWAVAGLLTSLYDGGVAGVYNELEWDKVLEKRPTKARVLWIETVQGGYDHDAGINESESHTTRMLTLCVLEGARSGRPSCPLQVPLFYEYDRDILIEEDEDQLSAEDKKLHTPGLPIQERRKLDVKLADDGTVTVVLVEGKADEIVKPLLGTRKIF